MSEELLLPHLGEGVESGTVVKILVAVGDTIQLEQAVIEMETDKASFEVPSSVAGVIEEIFVSIGDDVAVGGKILSVSAESAGTVREETRDETESADSGGREAAGRGDANIPIRKETRREPRASAERPEPNDGQTRRDGMTDDRIGGAAESPAPAAPSVRRFAREIGIEIGLVPGSGPGGRISIDDVKLYSKRFHEGMKAGGAGPSPEQLPDFSKWGTVERKPMSKIRQATAAHLSAAWKAVPQVTHFDRADIGRFEEVRSQYGEKAELSGGKLTLTAMLVKIAAGALKVFPQFNASIDMAANEIILKRYFNIGVAVDTERGLIVPVIRDVECKNIIDISIELARLSEKARDKAITLDELRGGCFTISNLGGIGGTAFTPIVNWPEAAILGMSRARVETVHRNGSFEARTILPLALSYDHRLIDGADAARFMNWLVEAIENPLLVMLEG